MDGSILRLADPAHAAADPGGPVAKDVVSIGPRGVPRLLG